MFSLKYLKDNSKRLKNEVQAVYYVFISHKVGIVPKIVIIIALAYILSPIDLVPDFIPVLGYLDDLILVPLGIVLLIKIIPRDVLEECRAKAEAELSSEKPKSWVAAIIIVLIWLSAIYFILSLIWPLIVPFSGGL